MIQRLNILDSLIAREIVQLQKASYKVEAELIGFDRIPPLMDTVETIKQSGEMFFGYYYGEALAGILSYKIEDRILDIHRVAVHPYYFRKGIATKLIEFILKRHPEVNDIIVSTAKANVPARKLYVKLDFELVSEKEVETGLSTVLYLKRQRLTTKEQLTNLIENKGLFAEIWTNMEQKAYTIKILDLPKEEKCILNRLEGATLIMAERTEHQGLEALFVALFKEYLYHHEEWDEAYGKNTTQKEWESILTESWIPTYLRPDAFGELSSDLFLLRFMAEITQLGLSIPESQAIIERCQGLKAIELRRGVTDYDVFAYNESIGLIYSWGITH